MNHTHNPEDSYVVKQRNTEGVMKYFCLKCTCYLELATGKEFGA